MSSIVYQSASPKVWVNNHTNPQIFMELEHGKNQKPFSNAFTRFLNSPTWRNSDDSFKELLVHTLSSKSSTDSKLFQYTAGDNVFQISDHEIPGQISPTKHQFTISHAANGTTKTLIASEAHDVKKFRIFSTDYPSQWTLKQKNGTSESTVKIFPLMKNTFFWKQVKNTETRQPELLSAGYLENNGFTLDAFTWQSDSNLECGTPTNVSVDKGLLDKIAQRFQNDTEIFSASQVSDIFSSVQSKLVAEKKKRGYK